jgi:putative flavoprotein involved in K+ transport
MKRNEATLIGSSPRKARRRGVTMHARTAGASGSAVRFADGTELEPATVIWATGFTLDHSWVHAPVFDPDGRLLHRRGVTPSRGLYFIGLPWQHTRGSALLGWVGADARYIAQQIDAAAKTARGAMALSV